MSKITLTDRISVSVRAKTDAQSSQQKVDTGKNIAKSLGVDDYNDIDAATIGNTSKPTITDENGNEWVSMQDIIDAGKKMYQDGAFEEKWSHPDFPNTYFTGVTSVSCHSNVGCGFDISAPDAVYMIPSTYNNSLRLHFISRSPFQVMGVLTGNGGDYTEQTNIQENSSYDTYNGQAVCTYVISIYPSNYYYNNGSSITRIPKNTYAYERLGIPDIFNQSDPTINNNAKMYNLLYSGHVAHNGGSLIDWSKPDDEIEEDIRQLHETWDVSEHEGAVTANGTYVLAGPIEYNDADPDSHSSGDF